MLDRIIALVMCMYLFIYCPYIILYRLYFHPLARYPGSKIAAMSTSSWEFYWNYYHNGQMLFEIERLHKVYGPVIRIGVNDLHVSDPEVYQDITRINSGFTKDVGFYLTISLPGTSIGETDPKKHWARRKVLSPTLSGTRVQELAPAILQKTKELLARFEKASDESSSICITSAAKAFTMDIISKIVLGQELGCVADPAFRNELTTHLDAVFRMGWTATAFPRLSALALRVVSMTSVLPFPVPLASLKRSCLSITKKYLDIFSPTHVANGTAPRNKACDTTNDSRSAVIDVLMDPANAETHPIPSLDELNDEVLMQLIAGNDTTSNAVIFAIYQIVTHSMVRQRLFHELKGALPSLGKEDWITYDQAKRLPYLTAAIKEALRLGSPIPGRLPRTVPREGYSLYGHWLPPEVNIHTSPYLLNRHPKIWDEPGTFKPERWLVEDAARLDKYIATFGRGARQCLGKELAFCEMYVLIANIFRRFYVDPHNTSREDMSWIDLVLVKYHGKFSARVQSRMA